MLGRPLIRLNYDQLDKEASFRSELIHVRDNAEAIMQAREESSQTARLLSRLDDLVANFRKITSINRNVGFFTTGYNWMIQIIPALIIAPAFIEGKIEFGVITQSAMAFTTLVAAFSLIVDPVPVAVEFRRGGGAAERARRGGRTARRSRTNELEWSKSNVWRPLNGGSAQTAAIHRRAAKGRTTKSRVFVRRHWRVRVMWRSISV